MSAPTQPPNVVGGGMAWPENWGAEIWERSWGPEVGTLRLGGIDALNLGGGAMVSAFRQI